MNLGWVLYGLHQFVLVLFLAAFITRPAIRPFLIIIFIPIMFFHVAGYGCPFTRVERHYHGHNVTIIDPMLHMFAIPVTTPNRKTFQAYFSSLLLLSMVLTVWAYPAK